MLNNPPTQLTDQNYWEQVNLFHHPFPLIVNVYYCGTSDKITLASKNLRHWPKFLADAKGLFLKLSGTKYP